MPGADLYDMLFTTGNIYNLLAGHQDNVMHDLILRDGEHTALEQAIGLQPTFVTMWIGNNDVLNAALAGTPVEGVTMTPVATFEQLYNTALGALRTQHQRRHRRDDDPQRHGDSLRHHHQALP